MIQPANFTNPPSGPEPPDHRLPTHCEECDELLNTEAWESETDWITVEVNEREREVETLVWFVECTECGSMVRFYA